MSARQDCLCGKYNWIKYKSKRRILTRGPTRPHDLFAISCLIFQKHNNKRRKTSKIEEVAKTCLDRMIDFNQELHQELHHVNPVTLDFTRVPKRSVTIAIAHTSTEMVLKTVFLLVNCLWTRNSLVNRRSEGRLKYYICPLHQNLQC